MKEGLESYYLTVFVDEKVRTSVAKSSHVARTRLLYYLALSCFLRLQYTIVVTTWSKKGAGCCFILGATHTKVMVFGGPFAPFGSMRICHAANPGGNSRKRVLSVCDELVSFFLFLFCDPVLFQFRWYSLVFEIVFFLAACQREWFSLRCKEIHPV